MAGQWQQVLGGEGGVVEHQVKLAHGLLSGLRGAVLEGAPGLPIQDKHTQQNGQRATEQGDQVASGGLSGAFDGQWHLRSL